MTADTNRTKKHGSRKPIYKANYGDATPTDVTMAVLRYRPDKQEKTAEKRGGNGSNFNPSV